MTTPAPARPSRGDVKRRRLEVEHRLVELGLAASRMPRVLRAPAHPAPAVVRLRSALESLGPVFSSLGRYLSSRMDLLSEQDSLVLAIPDHGPPTAPQQVVELLARELAPPAEAVFAAFDPTPAAVNLLTQRHRAQLTSGEPVMVEVVHPAVREQLGRDLEVLPTLSAALQTGELESLALDTALEDFAASVRHMADLGEQASALATLRHDGTVQTPWVAPSLTTPNVMVREWLDGPTLEALFPARDSEGGEAPAAGPRSEEIVSRLGRFWLRQTIQGQVYPVELDASRIVVSGQQIAWTGGTFRQLVPATQSNLWTYLVAVAGQHPDRACNALLEELEAGPRADPSALRRRLRQAVPFRDGGWAAHDDLAGYLFLHWRFAAELGFTPKPPLIGFYRSMARLATHTRRLAWRRDPLLEALQGNQLETGLGELGQLLDPRQMGETAEDFMRLMLTLPEKLDRVLTVAADGQPKLKLDMVEPPEEQRRKDSSSAVATLLLAMVAVGMLAHRLTPAIGPWVEGVATGMFLILGLFLLRTVGRKQ